MDVTRYQLHDNHEHAGTWIVEYDHRTPDAVLLEELPEEERLAQQTLERHEAIEAVKAAEVAAVAAAEKAKLHAVNAALAARQQEQHQQGAAGSPTSPTKKPGAFVVGAVFLPRACSYHAPPESPTKKKKAADDAAASKKPAPAPVVALTRKIFSAGMELLGFAKEETKLLVAWGNRLYRNPDRKTVHVDSISKTIKVCVLCCSFRSRSFPPLPPPPSPPKAMEQFKLDAAGALALRRLDQTMRHLNLPLAFLWAGADSRLKIYAPALRKTMKLVSAMKSPLGNEDRMVLVYVTRDVACARCYGVQLTPPFVPSLPPSPQVRDRHPPRHHTPRVRDDQRDLGAPGRRRRRQRHRSCRPRRVPHPQAAEGAVQAPQAAASGAPVDAAGTGP